VDALDARLPHAQAQGSVAVEPAALDVQDRRLVQDRIHQQAFDDLAPGAFLEPLPGPQPVLVDDPVLQVLADIGRPIRRQVQLQLGDPRRGAQHEDGWPAGLSRKSHFRVGDRQVAIGPAQDAVEIPVGHARWRRQRRQPGLGFGNSVRLQFQGGSRLLTGAGTVQQILQGHPAGLESLVPLPDQGIDLVMEIEFLR